MQITFHTLQSIMQQSIVEYFSEHEGYKCGYCKSTNTCYSHGMWAHRLTPLDYQNLIDRGWRRSGKYCYKPTMSKTCCPLYTIRCESMKFNPTRSQKKVLKKVHKFLAYGKEEKSKEEPSSSVGNPDEGMDVERPQEVDVQSYQKIKKIKTLTEDVLQMDNIEALDPKSDSQPEPKETCDKPSSSHSSSHSSNHSSETSSPLKSSGLSNNVPQCRKAKILRQERKLQKLLKKGMSEEEATSSLKKKASDPKTIEDFLSEPFPPNPAHKIELRLVPSSLENSQFSQTFEESYSLYKKYQMAIHGDPAEKCSTKQYTRFLVNNPFQFRFVKVESDEFNDTLEESYKVYKKYQMKIHKETEEECQQEYYENFLVETPLENDQDSSKNGFGSYHQQYWLDNKLIAVGVIDILPYCLSSVYFYYDPDYYFLSLGTYAALREIAFTRELNARYPDLQYYYMGYYIHSCIKMRYKGQYVPSFLLCPETYIFKPIEKSRQKLDITKYNRLEDDPKKEDHDGVVNLKEVLILYNKTKLTYAQYRNMKKENDEEEVKEYANFVGRKCYRNILLYRD